MTSDQETAMEALVAGIAAAIPARHVQRKLIDPANESKDRLAAGVICVVSTGGGNFANWTGREGELGTMNVKAVGFVQVPMKDPVTGLATTGEDVEKAELALLGDLLSFCKQIHQPPIDSVLPGDYMQSQQLSHPLGFLALDLKVHGV